MIKFICLTEICGNDAVKPLLINAAHIQHIQLGNKGKDVHVRMSDKTFFFVKESLAEIRELIIDAGDGALVERLVEPATAGNGYHYKRAAL